MPPWINLENSMQVTETNHKKNHILNISVYLHCLEQANLQRDLWLPWHKERRHWRVTTNGCFFWGQRRCSKIRLWGQLHNSEYTKKRLNCTLQICEIVGCQGMKRKIEEISEMTQTFSPVQHLNVQVYFAQHH